MASCGSADKQALLILATLASLQISQKLSCDELELLSAFFEVLGDNLALLAVPLSGQTAPCSKKDVEG